MGFPLSLGRGTRRRSRCRHHRILHLLEVLLLTTPDLLPDLEELEERGARGDRSGLVAERGQRVGSELGGGETAEPVLSEPPACDHHSQHHWER